MGICISCEKTCDTTTAKLILEDGELIEFSYPVKVSYVLTKYHHQQQASFFICNSDDMEFDDQLSPIHDDDELQLGQLYFALPLTRLRYPLQPEEMAALAVKASSALMKNASSITLPGNRKQVAPVNFITSTDRKQPRHHLELIMEKKTTKCGGGRGCGRGRNFTSKLGAIPE